MAVNKRKILQEKIRVADTPQYPFELEQMQAPAGRWAQPVAPNNSGPMAKIPTHNTELQGGITDQRAFGSSPTSAYHPIRTDSVFDFPEDDTVVGPPNEDAYRSSSFAQTLEKLLGQGAPRVPPLHVRSGLPSPSAMKADGSIYRGLRWDYNVPDSTGWVYPEGRRETLRQAVKKAIPKAQKLASAITNMFKG